MYHIYILYSKSSDKFYIGHSENPWERLIQHNTDTRDTYTSKHRPWVLAAVFSVGENRADAMKIEKWIKKQKSKSLITKLIDPAFVPVDNLAQLIRVPQLRD